MTEGDRIVSEELWNVQYKQHADELAAEINAALSAERERAKELVGALKELVLFKHFPESKNPRYTTALRNGIEALADYEQKDGKK